MICEVWVVLCKVNNMDKHYAIKKYIALILQAIKENRNNTNTQNENFEKHHILPKSIFPEFKYEQKNIVLLKPYEHIIAHYYLCFIFTEDNKMTFAFNMITNTRYNILLEDEQTIISDIIKLYKEQKPNIHLSEEHKQKISQSEKGKLVSNETKEKLKISHKKQAKKVKGTNIITGEIIEFDSIGEAYRQTKIRHIAETCLHRNGRTTAGGYTWEYIL